MVASLRPALCCIAIGFLLAQTAPALAQSAVLKRNIETIGTPIIQQSINSVSLSKATAYARHFCLPNLNNLRTIKRNLRKTGYLQIFQGTGPSAIQLYGHPKAAPIVALIDDQVLGNGCGVVAQKKSRTRRAIQRVLEANIGSKVVRVKGFRSSQSIRNIWQNRPDDGTIYAEAAGQRFSGIFLFRIKK